MSFSNNAKTEILTNLNVKPCCFASFINSLLADANDENAVTLMTTHNNVLADLFYERIKYFLKIYSLDKIFSIACKEVILLNKRAYVVEIFDREMMSLSGMKLSIGNCENCDKTYLAAKFIGRGTIGNPQNGYILQIASNDVLLKELLDKYEVNAKTMKRSGKTVYYLKESEKIEDFLTLIGAPMSAIEVMNIKVLKDMRNKANRLSNCDNANIEKTLKSMTNQINAIEKIIINNDFDSLGEDLKEIAMLRLDNTEASLEELAALTKGKLSRSGVNYRLNKIINYAKKYQ